MHHRVKLAARVREGPRAQPWFLSEPRARKMEPRAKPYDLDADWPVGPPNAPDMWCTGDASGTDGLGYFGPGCHTYRAWVPGGRVGPRARDNATVSTWIEAITMAGAVMQAIVRADGGCHG